MNRNSRNRVLGMSSKHYHAAAVLFVSCSATFAQSQTSSKYSIGDMKALESSFVQLSDTVRPSVVAIRAYQVRAGKEADTRLKVPVSQGSGFIIDSDGFIATNMHVIDSGHVLSVTLYDGTTYDATLVQKDERADLAVLSIDAKHLPAIRWGDAARVRVNQWAFACGNPFGLANRSGQPSITYGVVSALGRDMTERIAEDTNIHYYGNLIETSAAINPGSSGGPLFNLDGEAIGVVTAIQTSTGVNEGMGFAIPIDVNTRRILEKLKRGEAVRYGYLGVGVDDVEAPTSARVADMRRVRGARITKVEPSNGPAALAGLSPDDVVIEFNGTPIENRDHLIRVVGFTPVGTEATVKYLRKHVERKATLKVVDRPGLFVSDARSSDDPISK
jgi:serine protease Do